MNTIYQKPYFTPEKLIHHLKKSGLAINNEAFALKFLANINYHRFKIYLHPLRNSQTGKYREDSSFEEAVELYRYDDELRDLLFSIIGRIEIKIRSRLDHTISGFTGDPFWYLDDSYFVKGNAYHFRSSLSSQFIQARDEYSTHYKLTYINNRNPNYKIMPPFWSAIELSTFGNVNSIYKSLDKKAFIKGPKRNILDDLSSEFGAKNLKTFNNWLDLIRDIRNKCAHHSRTWNRNLREPSGVIQKLEFKPTHQNRIYLFFVLLEIINRSIGIEFNIKTRLLELFDKYPSVKQYLSSMGVPENWDSDRFWKDQQFGVKK